jgi:hypothetical protein
MSMKHKSDAAMAMAGGGDIVSEKMQALEAARHMCQEARVVLTSLRGGPPNVARGELAQDLMDVRVLIKRTLSSSPQGSSSGTNNTSTCVNLSETTTLTVENLLPPTPPSVADAAAAINGSPPTAAIQDKPDLEDEEGGAVWVEMGDGDSQRNSVASLPPASKQFQGHHGGNGRGQPPSVTTMQDVGPYARPFLAVVMDPRAAGPHTLVALRALHRLLSRGSLKYPGCPKHGFPVALEPLTKGVLSCKFEQTDAGADEAVEMAIADLLAFLVSVDRRAIHTETLMDAFNTVFVTRNTFVHSPALCYHFEDVLTAMVKAVFDDLEHLADPAAMVILEFLVNQLLHTPLVGGDDDASRDAQVAHDATRVLCLRLSRVALRHAFHNIDDEILSTLALSSATDDEKRSLLYIVQDDLCLSLLMTGQAIWAYQENNGISPGFISLEVLSEICATLSTLWTTPGLRKHLVPQFEAIFTGFYQRALVLLRKRVNPTDSATFHANLVFDAGIEIILESLVDVMCIHDHRQTVAQGNGGSLETLFATYDCNVRRSDVAVGLMIELCRCSGSQVDEEGDTLEDPLTTDVPAPDKTVAPRVVSPPATPRPPGAPSRSESYTDPSPVDSWRQVPAHLKELCAEAIAGGMKCLFRDDHPSEQTRVERRGRQSIMSGHLDVAPVSFSDVAAFQRARSMHQLRSIKSKKRLMRKAAHMFNKKSSKGIDFLLTSGLVPNPVTPRSVASFLRNGIVVGLDKKAVGAYLGEVGKSPQAGKSPPNWERDWFHKEVLAAYCSLFRFERQSLLDGLRMFLAAFRLPGEAQQIDRILQAFSDSCGQICEESAHGSTRLFSDDPKRASDAAYLLSFSIIMLNTDLHNDNIREDRKMSKADFVKNNSDYGQDITEKGKEFPREYLESIYSSIRDEEIRTEGEGADGSMTVERWKDVLRGSAGEDSSADVLPSNHDAEDLTELVLEHVWMPIMSAIGALWGVSRSFDNSFSSPAQVDAGSSGMLGAQGSRLGMDMALDMLIGVRQLGRKDIFCKIFYCVCDYTGLLRHTSNSADRTWSFANSLEAQSAVVVALRVAREASDEIGVDGWKRVWSILFELRDLKMLGGGVASRGRSILMESDADFLKEDARRDWTMKLVKGGINGDEVKNKPSGMTSMFGAVGRALFGSIDDASINEAGEIPSREEVVRTIHGKEDHIVWDEIAPSDDEDELDPTRFHDANTSFSMPATGQLSAGAQFESQLIHEDMMLRAQREMPVTGLERVDDTQRTNISPRARVRKRLLQACDYAGIVSESRLMSEEGIGNLLQALVDIVETAEDKLDRLPGEPSTTEAARSKCEYPLSPASEGFAEVLICEIALRNRDRLNILWYKVLQAHYLSRLETISHMYTETEKEHLKMVNAGIEKTVTGLLRLSYCAVHRGVMANEILETWKVLNLEEEMHGKKQLLGILDKHLGEGCWRITRSVDGTSRLTENGWSGLLSLVQWCAQRGGQLPPMRSSGIGRPVGLAEDDPALQAYRSLHFLLNACEIKELVPPTIVKIIVSLVPIGERRNCPKLCMAALDLLQVVNDQVGKSASAEVVGHEDESIWKSRWRPLVEGIAEASEMSGLPVSHQLKQFFSTVAVTLIYLTPSPPFRDMKAVRQYSLSMLADSFLDKRGGLIPIQDLCSALAELCIPLAGRRIISLRDGGVNVEDFDELMIELELCIGLIFKPLRHHLKNVVDEGQVTILSLWKPVLDVLTEILGSPHPDGYETVEEHTVLASDKVLQATNDLTLGHLRNVIMVLIGYGVLAAEQKAPGDFTALTWDAVGKIEVCQQFLDEWKTAALQTPS